MKRTRNEKMYNHSDECGLIYRNKSGDELRWLDQDDVDTLLKMGYIQKRDDGSYETTENRYTGIALADIFDSMEIYDAVIQPAYVIEIRKEDMND